MNDTWTKHYEGVVEGRRVSVKTYSGGGYRVSTTQGQENQGDVYSDESSVTIIPSSLVGAPIDIDAESIDEMRGQLVQEGFSADAAAEIVGHFPV